MASSTAPATWPTFSRQRLAISSEEIVRASDGDQLHVDLAQMIPAECRPPGCRTALHNAERVLANGAQDVLDLAICPSSGDELLMHLERCPFDLRDARGRRLDGGLLRHGQERHHVVGVHHREQQTSLTKRPPTIPPVTSKAASASATVA